MDDDVQALRRPSGRPLSGTRAACSESASARPVFSSAYKRYALVTLTTLYGVSLFDRSLITLLLQPIKVDLGLSDTQLGLFTGIAFGLFYATVGVPIARWADRGNRVTITSLTLGLWALTSMAFFFVTSFVQLLAIRMVAAVGDAGCKPLTYSLLGDYFPERAERTRAMYGWFLAGPLAALVSWSTAGWINEHYGWRVAFLLTGLLGVPLAIIVKCTLVEPRTRMPATSIAPQPVPPFKAVLEILWRQPSCRHTVFGLIVLFTAGFGAAGWQAAFIIRQHGIGTAELGVWMGVGLGLAGICSVFAGRYVVGRWLTRESQQMRAAAISLAIWTPGFIAFVLIPIKELALSILILQTFIIGVFTPAPYVILQQLVPERMRATALMVVMLLANLIGMGIGPLIVGVLSDALQPRFGVESLRYAMILMALVWLWAAYHFSRVARTIDADLSKAGQHAMV